MNRIGVRCASWGNVGWNRGITPCCVASIFATEQPVSAASALRPLATKSVLVLSAAKGQCGLDGAFVRICYFVTTFTPLRFFASMAFCTTPVCFASSTSVASRACAAGERPFGSAAATRTVPKAPGTILAPTSDSAAGYPTPKSAPKTFALPERRRSAASAAMVGLEGCGQSRRP